MMDYINQLMSDPAFQTTMRAIIATVIGGLILKALVSPFQELLKRFRRWRNIKVFDKSFLGMAGDKNQVLIETYQAMFISRNPIDQINGYVRSNFTNQRVPLLTNQNGSLVTFANDKGVPPNVKIAIGARFNIENKNRLQVGDFLENWGDFTVHIFLDGDEYSKRYSISQVYRLIDAFRRQNEDPRLRPKIGR